MGRVFLIQFDQTPQNVFYLCCKCQAHIALEEERRFSHVPVNARNAALFRNAVNWHRIESEPNRKVTNYTIANIYCNNCGNLLGVQFIELPNGSAMKEKNILLYLFKLLVWDGNAIANVL